MGIINRHTRTCKRAKTDGTNHEGISFHFPIRKRSSVITFRFHPINAAFKIVEVKKKKKFLSHACSFNKNAHYQL